FAETLAIELQPYNILVNAIAPGPVDTRMQDEILAAGDGAGDEGAEVSALRASGGFTSPTVAADLSVFLASTDADGLTGRLISAVHDPWRSWAGRGSELSRSPLFTLRRLDPASIRPVKDVV